MNHESVPLLSTHLHCNRILSHQTSWGFG